MCGIAGVHGVFDPCASVRLMTEALRHRGPDDEGYYHDGALALGMRRLKIIDLVTGSQPIFNEDRSIAVVYNGEIFNFRELREQLETQGHQFATASDTEVIVHLYEEDGDACVERLRGMWAFALWDQRRERLLLARDRMGIKPLYYLLRGGTLAFASELKAILRLPGFDRRVRLPAIHDYLTYMYVPGPGTIYEDVHELSPAHILTFEAQKHTLKRYWQVPSVEEGQSPQPDAREAGEELRGRIADAVRSSLISDVPLGVFLSGGLDSALVVAMMAAQGAGPIRTFSIGFRDAAFNELDQAATVARHFGTDHHQAVLDPPGPDDVIRIVQAFDEPFADSSAIPTFVVSRMARAEVPVALSGDGGDEIFGGYNNYRADLLAMQYRKVPGPVRRGAAMVAAAAGFGNADAMSWSSKLGRVMALADMDPRTGHVWWLTAFSEDLKNELYADRGLRALVGAPSTRYEGVFRDRPHGDFIAECMAVDMQTVLPNDYLKKTDRMSMVNSLELRVPLLDHHLVEFAARLPSVLKVTRRGTKLLLRQIVETLLPREIVRGRKRGFSIPLSRWLRTTWADLVRTSLSQAAVRKLGFFNPHIVNRYITEHMMGERDHGKALWVLMCLHIWGESIE